MKQNTWAGLAILSLLLSACTNTSAEPSLSANDVQSTAVAMAFTVVAKTQAAIPTNTSIPPTDTPVPTPLPSNTPISSPTTEESTVVSPTVIPPITSQPVSVSPTADPCNKPLTSWDGRSASINLIYEYTPQSKDDKVVVSMWVMSDLGECGFLYDLSRGPVGQYSVAAYVDGPKDFKVFGGFRLTEATWDIVIRNNTIVALGSCYPNC